MSEAERPGRHPVVLNEGHGFQAVGVRAKGKMIARAAPASRGRASGRAAERGGARRASRPRRDRLLCAWQLRSPRPDGNHQPPCLFRAVQGHGIAAGTPPATRGSWRRAAPSWRRSRRSSASSRSRVLPRGRDRGAATSAPQPPAPRSRARTTGGRRDACRAAGDSERSVLAAKVRGEQVLLAQMLRRQAGSEQDPLRLTRPGSGCDRPAVPLLPGHRRGPRPRDHRAARRHRARARSRAVRRGAAPATRWARPRGAGPAVGAGARAALAGAGARPRRRGHPPPAAELGHATRRTARAPPRAPRGAQPRPCGAGDRAAHRPPVPHSEAGFPAAARHGETGRSVPQGRVVERRRKAG